MQFPLNLVFRIFDVFFAAVSVWLTTAEKGSEGGCVRVSVSVSVSVCVFPPLTHNVTACLQSLQGISAVFQIAIALLKFVKKGQSVSMHPYSKGALLPYLLTHPHTHTHTRTHTRARTHPCVFVCRHSRHGLCRSAVLLPPRPSVAVPERRGGAQAHQALCQSQGALNVQT